MLFERFSLQKSFLRSDRLFSGSLFLDSPPCCTYTRVHAHAHANSFSPTKCRSAVYFASTSSISKLKTKNRTSDRPAAEKKNRVSLRVSKVGCTRSETLPAREPHKQAESTRKRKTGYTTRNKKLSRTVPTAANVRSCIKLFHYLIIL